MTDEPIDRLPLTDRQQWFLNLVISMTRPYGPTVRELCEASGIKSPNGVMCHLKALERKGRLRRTPGKARDIEVVNA